MVEQLPPSHLKSKRQIKIWKQQQNDNTAKRQKADSYTSQDPFRYSERNFKSRIIPTDIMAQVVDTSQLLDSNFSPSLQQQHGIRHVTLATDLRFERPDIFGLVDESWKRRSLDAFVITQIPGLIIIPNPFTPKAQRRLIQLCLTDYTLPPNTSNLDAHYDRPKKGIWDLYQREYEGLLTAEDKEYYVPSKANDKQLGNNNLYGNNGDDTATNRTPLLPPSDLLRKQRWITLGYQYDWKTKLYDLENGLPMPEELNDLAKAVVSAAEGIGYSNDEHSSSESTTSWKNTYRGSTFKAEAGVINYYQLRDTLMAHVDKSEVNMEAPIVSVSFGHACIYLIGGTSKNVAPIPVCLRSGDLILMTGSSRKSYHGVPRILENTLPDYLMDQDDWKLYSNYMASARINLNIRQVFPSQN